MLNLSAPTNATILDGQGVCTIYDTSQPGLAVNFSASPVAEGHNGTAFVQFLVTLSQAPTSPITINYSTAHGTATAADNDYTPISGSVTFLPVAEEFGAAIWVPVRGDMRYEPNETFQMNISSSNNVVILQDHTTVSILNDDPNYGSGGYCHSLAQIGNVGASFTQIGDGLPYDLIGHAFNFFGTGITRFFPNANGTITFDGPMSDPNNTDLSQETRPMIVDLGIWVSASGASRCGPRSCRPASLPALGNTRTHDYLLIRWANVHHPAGTPNYTFTTALELDTARRRERSWSGATTFR